LSGAFFITAAPLAQARGLVPHFETGLFDDEADYRVPDLLFCRPEHLSERGAEGADIVVEVRSPDDESYAKLDFYAAKGVGEVLVLHPKGRRFELFRLVDGRLCPVSTDAEGAVGADVLGIRLATVDGTLRITWAEGSADI
jgi:Uma2 family endonuclease